MPYGECGKGADVSQHAIAVARSIAFFCLGYREVRGTDGTGQMLRLLWVALTSLGRRHHVPVTAPLPAVRDPPGPPRIAVRHLVLPVRECLPPSVDEMLGAVLDAVPAPFVTVLAGLVADYALWDACEVSKCDPIAVHVGDAFGGGSASGAVTWLTAQYAAEYHVLAVVC